MQVTGVITQGRGDGSEWVSEYLVSYSPDGEKWSYVTDNSEIARVSSIQLLRKKHLSTKPRLCWYYDYKYCSEMCPEPFDVVWRVNKFHQSWC